MKNLKFLGGAALLTAASIVWAGNVLVSVESQGNGKTEREAIDDALARAAGQVNGAAVEVDSSTLRSQSQTTVTTSWGDSASASTTSELSRSARYEAQGQIKGYKMLSSTKVDGGYRVKLKADVIRYEVSGENNNLSRIAILPVRYRSESYPFYGSIPGAELAANLGTELESKLLSSRQFSLLDRATLNASLRELGIVDSDLTGPEEKAKLQRIKGADFVVLSTIRQATDRYNGGVNPVTGQMMGEFRFELEVRVMVPATGELRASNVYKITKQRDRDEAIEAMGTSAISGLVDEIYPGRGGTVRRAALTTVKETPAAITGVKLPFDR